MKTRIVKTKFWTDSKVRKLSPNARYLYIYLLTCPYVSLTSFFEVDDGQIILDTGLTAFQLKEAKKELEKNGRVFFHESWVFIPNLDKHNPYWKSPKTKKAYERELKNLPKIVVDYFKNKIDSSIDTTIDTTMHTTHKTENRKHKTEIINNKKENIKNKTIIKEKELALKRIEEMKKKLRHKLNLK